MSTSEIVGVVLRLIVLLVSAFKEKNADLKLRKTEAYDLVRDGLKKRDITLVTRGFDHANSAR